MRGVTASAPGKVVLCGEYAVLEGAPAICMAVDRRAVAHVEESPEDGHVVSAPGFTALSGRFRVDGGHTTWTEGEDEYPLVAAVLQTVREMPSASTAIRLDTLAFHDDGTGRKIGIGASASLTVALVAALRRTTDVFDDSLSAHRRFQRGSGSGIDIAAAVHGGLIRFRMPDTSVRRLSWPEGLHYRLVWSGASADTRAKLAQLDRTRDPRSCARFAEAATRMAEAWCSAATVLDEFPGYIEHLRRFSVDHGLGIFDAGHDRLTTDAAASGLVYKPCGAGGGDVGIVLADTDKKIDEFVDGRAQTLPYRLDTDGVKVERY